MNVLVTGGAGYLGSHLVRMLLKSDHRVTLLDSFLYGKAGVAGLEGNSNLRIVEGDICHISDVVRAVRGSEAVIALAAIVGDPACNLNEEETLNTNYEATKVLVEICNYYKVRRLIFASSCSVYGAAQNLILNEGSLLNPVSLYAKTRIMSEKILLDNPNEDLISTVFRMGTLYGWSFRMRFDLAVNFMTAKALREGGCEVFGGDQWRPFVHVQDAAAAYVKALTLDPSVLNREIYNIGFNEQNHRILEIADHVRSRLSATAVQTHSNAQDRRDYRISFDKFNHIFQLPPAFSVPAGIDEIIRRMQENPVDFRDHAYYNVKYLFREGRTA